MTAARAAGRCSWSAKTTKGKGVSYMENVPIWHYRSPNKDEYQQGLEGAGEGADEKYVSPKRFTS